MNSLKAQVSIGLICLVLGFLVTLQARSVVVNYINSNKELKRLEDANTEISNQKNINAELRLQIADISDDLNKFREEAAKTSDSAALLTEQLAKAEMSAGLVAVEGEGIVITLNDAVGKTPGNSMYEIVHDENLRRVVTELYSAGAEAVSVNNERIMATTPIRCIGPVILINNTRLSPPYVIKAIGNPDTLESAINLRDGIGDILKNIYRLQVDIRKEKNLVLPRFNGTISFQYAKPASIESAKEVTP